MTMNMTELLAPLEPAPAPDAALATRDPRLEQAAQQPAITPAQARVEAVAEALASAYQRASTLTLTPEEANALSENFPDEAFSLGAGGDQNLIYIEHAYLRQRLNTVLGVGAAVPIRRREWAEEFSYIKDGKQKKGVRVYVDMVLLVRGCVVGEAIGDSVYYPDNAKTNYSDALESAKSGAFRRCAKEFGVGLQAWMKGWCEGWKSRQFQRREATQFRPTATTQARPTSTAPATRKTDLPVSERIAALKNKLGSRVPWAEGYLHHRKADGSDANSDLMPNEGLEALSEQSLNWLAHNWNDFEDRLATYIAENDSLPDDKQTEAEAPQSTPQSEGIGGPSVDGTIELVSVKQGENARGAWTCVGIKIQNQWFNSFSRTLREAAEKLKGQRVELFYEQTAKGFNAIAIKHNGNLIKASDA